MLFGPFGNRVPSYRGGLFPTKVEVVRGERRANDLVECMEVWVDGWVGGWVGGRSAAVGVRQPPPVPAGLPEATLAFMHTLPLPLHLPWWPSTYPRLFRPIPPSHAR